MQTKLNPLQQKPVQQPFKQPARKQTGPILQLQAHIGHMTLTLCAQEHSKGKGNPILGMSIETRADTGLDSQPADDQS